MRLDDLAPRLTLARTPTPLEPLPRLSARLGLELLVKRDDLTGSHLSGNKIRKLEYLLAEARALGATAVVTCGGAQSNHCRATALASAPLGLECALVLRTPRGRAEELEPARGNLLLDRLAGASLRTCTPAEYRAWPSLLEGVADELRARGARPYIIPQGGSNALGSLGYVRAVEELLEQAGDKPPSAVVVATGSGGTLAGVALGLKALGARARAVGVPICDDPASFRRVVLEIAAEAAARFGLPRLTADDFTLLDGYQGRGYALSSEEELALLRETARADGLVLDPVYTVKAFRGLLDRAGSDALPGPRVVFVHTGGIFGLGVAGPPLYGSVVGTP